MTYFYLVPSSFLKFSIVMEIIFAIISLLVSYYSFKIYRISKQREIKLFGISFILITLSYLIWAFIHSAIVFHSIVEIAQLATSNISRLGGIGMLLYIILFITGLGTLAYTTARTKNGKIYYLIIGLSIMSIIIPLGIMLLLFEPTESSSLYNLLISSRLVSIFFLTFIIFNYFEEYAKNKNRKTLLIGTSFSLLLISNTNFIFSLSYYQAYIIGHILESIAYLFILISLILSVKK